MAWKTDGVLFHQDNAPAHQSVVTMAVVHDCGFELVDHPPYSPDLAPSGHFLFPNMKKNTWLRSSIELMMSSYAVADFMEDQDETFYTTENPSAATSMKEVHMWIAGETTCMLKKKPH